VPEPSAAAAAANCMADAAFSDVMRGCAADANVRVGRTGEVSV